MKIPDYDRFMHIVNILFLNKLNKILLFLYHTHKILK